VYRKKNIYKFFYFITRTVFLLYFVCIFHNKRIFHESRTRFLCDAVFYLLLYGKVAEKQKKKLRRKNIDIFGENFHECDDKADFILKRTNFLFKLFVLFL
jgi:hypothetical protein